MAAKAPAFRRARRKRLYRAFPAIFAVSVVMLGVATNASATDMHCANGYCSWGYNYVGPSTNFVVNGTWNNWYDQYLDKTSGGTIHHGFYSGGTPNCFEYKSGAVTWYGHPGDTGSGCGPYVRPYVQYDIGNTSYLFFDDLT